MYFVIPLKTHFNWLLIFKIMISKFHEKEGFEMLVFVLAWCIYLSIYMYIDIYINVCFMLYIYIYSIYYRLQLVDREYRESGEERGGSDRGEI